MVLLGQKLTDLNAGRRYFWKGTGTCYSCFIFFAGEAPTTSPGKSTATESWNGTSWTEVNDLNTARGRFGSGAGMKHLL